jgi:hypothetical protein
LVAAVADAAFMKAAEEDSPWPEEEGMGRMPPGDADDVMDSCMGMGRPRGSEPADIIIPGPGPIPGPCPGPIPIIVPPWVGVGIGVPPLPPLELRVFSGWGGGAEMCNGTDGCCDDDEFDGNDINDEIAAAAAVAEA